MRIMLCAQSVSRRLSCLAELFGQADNSPEAAYGCYSCVCYICGPTRTVRMHCCSTTDETAGRAGGYAEATVGASRGRVVSGGEGVVTSFTRAAATGVS